jgi:hypothetical protein
MMKTPTKQPIELPQPYENSTTNIIVIGEKLKAFPLISGTK